jgi:uncharacterized protein YuzE
LSGHSDSLYIDLLEATSTESREVSEGVVLDYDEAGNLVGIDIDNAGNKVQMQRFIVSRLRAKVSPESEPQSWHFSLKCRPSRQLFI